MAKRTSSSVSDFRVGDCVIVSKNASRFRGYQGRVVELQTSVVWVRLQAKTGRLVRATFDPADLEKVSPCPDNWPVPPMMELASRSGSAFRYGDCVRVLDQNKEPTGDRGRVTKVLRSELEVFFVKNLGISFTLRLDKSLLWRDENCPGDWPVLLKDDEVKVIATQELGTVANPEKCDSGKRGVLVSFGRVTRCYSRDQLWLDRCTDQPPS